MIIILFVKYISPCEAIWRLLVYETQYRYPPVKRLSFHLEGKQFVTYNNDDDLNKVIMKPSIQQS